MDIIVKTIPHSTQRYPTVGDWYFNNEDAPTVLYIMVSDMGNPLYEYLVAQHEQIEAMLCLHDGVKEADVSTFDIEFENKRKPGDFTEPGDSGAAPYFHQHQIATMVERNLAAELEVTWEDYEAVINSL